MGENVEVARKLDSKGRPYPSDMTDREIAEETVMKMRYVEDMLDGMSKNPMLSAFLPKV